MKTSFTPGPWSYGGLIGNSPGAIVANGGGVQVATAKVVPLMYGQQITSEEANANARLIAAAPDLLEQLRDAVAFIAQAVADGILNAEECGPLIEGYRSAIDKSTGEA